MKKLLHSLVVAASLASGLAAAGPRTAMLYEEDIFCSACAATFNNRTLMGVIKGLYPDLQLIPQVAANVLAPALASTDVLFVPFIADAVDVARFTPESLDVIRRFVEGGGKIIFRMHHRSHQGNRDLGEKLFGFRYPDVVEAAAAAYTCDATAAMNIGFQGVPASGRAPYYGESLQGALPQGAVSICKSGADATILAAKPYGDGMIFFEGIYNSTTMDYSPEQARLTKEMAEADLVGSHRCYLKNAELKCAGGNGAGQLGKGDKVPHVDTWGALTAVDLGRNFRAARIESATGSSCAVSTAGQVKCWGLNKDGQLGIGDVAPRGVGPNELGDSLPALGLGLKALDVAVGRSHACAVLEGGKLRCWGKGAAGQLGSESTATVGAAMGDVPVLVDVAGDVVAVRAGRNHTCVLRDDQTVSCFGDNALGQLGIGSRVNAGDRPDTMGEALARVDLGTGFKVLKLATGLDFNCALSDEGRIKCWGSNDAGQLGHGTAVQAVGTEPADMGDALPFTDLGDKQLATDLQCGAYHCCARTLQNTMKCWGANDAGQLGLGDSVSRGRQADMGDHLPFAKLPVGERVSAMSLNGNTTCATTDSGTRCWGGNSTGQLATGDKLNRGDKPQSVPRLLPPLF